MVIVTLFHSRGSKGILSPYMYNADFLIKIIKDIWDRDEVRILFLDNFDSAGNEIIKSGKKVDVLFIMSSYVSGRVGFNMLKMLADKAEKVVGVFNEYGSYRFLQLSRHEFLKKNKKWFVVLNFVLEGMQKKLGKIADKLIEKFWLVNLNVIKYKDWDGRFYTDNGKFLFKEDLVYYGSYRSDRNKYFKKYFCDERVVVSTSKKNFDKFLKLGCKARFVDKFEWKGGYCEDLLRFKSSLYIEDVFTHKHFNFLANRWYECMVHRVPMFFDISCKGTIKKSGKSIDKFWLVDGLRDIFRKLEDKRFEEIKEKDLYLFKKEFFEERDKIIEDLYKIMKEIRDYKIR